MSFITETQTETIQVRSWASFTTVYIDQRFSEDTEKKEFQTSVAAWDYIESLGLSKSQFSELPF